MNQHAFLGVVAIALTLIAFVPYITSILRGTTRPHVISWVIWACATFAIAMAQFLDGGGAGAWPIAVSGVITGYVAILAYYKKGDSQINILDWFFLVVAMLGLALWWWQNNALYAVVILTLIDLCGFAPTFRKAWRKPHEENALFFSIMTVRNILAAMALEHYSVTTLLFPTLTALACGLLLFVLVWRRHMLHVI